MHYLAHKHDWWLVSRATLVGQGHDAGIKAGSLAHRTKQIHILGRQLLVADNGGNLLKERHVSTAGW